MNLTLRTGFRILFVVCLLGLTVGSLLPNDSLPGQSVNDKFVHVIAYAGAGLLACLAFRRTSVRLACMLMLVLLGIGLEVGQTFVPGRSFELGDMAANGVGTIAAMVTLCGRTDAKSPATVEP